jgi:DNA-directed RNA polymerase specialized sigma24 family protein
MSATIQIQVETSIKEREALFIQLYKMVFPLTAKYVSKVGGSFEQAKDVFQDALVIYYEKQSAGTLDLNTDEKAYIYGIARHLWIKRYKEHYREVLFKDSTVAMEDITAQPSSPKILRYLEAAGQKCMELLRAFYYDKTKLEDIASAFGFSGVRSATAQKFKCLEKIREKVKEKSLAYEDFLE